MPVKSTDNHYGSFAIVIHWLSALLVLLLLVSGFRAGGLEASAMKAEILRVHVPLGIAILLLTIVRLSWWLFMDKKPGPIDMPQWQQRASTLVHQFLYLVILGMAASGIGMMILSEAGPTLFAGSSNILPDFHEFMPRLPHGLGARLIVALVIVHACAALYHQFVKSDGLIRRIWFGSS